MLTIGLCTLSLSSIAANLERPLRPLGEPAPSKQATRTIIITPTTKYVQVTSGETVKFISGGKDFTWHFQGLEGRFNLAQIAPSGKLDRAIKGYLAPDPLYNSPP
jgi:hypothetical protein